MSAVHAGDVEEPHKNYPRALLYSAVLIIITLLCGSLAIALVIPAKQIGLVTGLIDAYGIFFKAYHLSWMIDVMAALIVLSSLSGVAAWIIGPTRGLWVAAQAGSLPTIFAKVNNKGAPVAILILQGVIFTILCSLFLFMPSVNSTYWILTALTSQLALLFYILMFAAAIKLRYKDAQTPRTYRIPGGNFGMWLVAGCGIITCIGVILVGFLPPSNLHITNVFTYEMILIGGIIVFSIPPFIIDALEHLWSDKHKN
jgi:amino acid transporter